MSTQINDNPPNKWLPLLLGLACAVGLFFGTKIQLPREPKSENLPAEANKAIQKMTDAFAYINSKYDDSLDYQTIVDKSLYGLTQELDPYSNYSNLETKQAEIDDLDGDYFGVGIECRKVGSRFFIDKVYDKSPAQENGIQFGDELITINEKILDSTYSTKKIIDLIKSAPSKVKLEVNTSSGKLFKELTKREIALPSIGFTYSPEKGVVYVSIHNFGEKTYQELIEKLDQQSQNGKIKKLILDLRNNSGGYVSAVADILNQLIPEKDQFMFETFGSKIKSRVYKTLGRPFFKYDKIIILVNQNTASASEILAGTLQDLDIATIIGTNTVGKGTILEHFELADGSILRLVTGRYKLPSGRILQKPLQDGSEISLQENNTKQEKIFYSLRKNKKLANAQGIIPDIILENKESNVREFSNELSSNSEDFVLQNREAIHKLNLSSSSDIFTNPHVEKFITERSTTSKDSNFITANQSVIEIKHAILYLLYGDKKLQEELLKRDALYLKAVSE